MRPMTARRTLARLGCALLAALLLACSPQGAPSVATVSAVGRLSDVGDRIEGELSDLPRVEVEMALRGGELVHVQVDQSRVDWAVKVLAPSAEVVLDLDSPDGWEDPEHLWWLAEKSGTYRLLLTLVEGEAARPGFRLTWVERRVPTVRDLEYLKAARISDSAEVLRRRGEAPESVVASYRDALRRWTDLDEEHLAADVRRRWARYLFEHQKDPTAALPMLEVARAEFARLGHGAHVASTDLLSAKVYQELGRAREAAAAFRRAIPHLVRKRERAYALNELGSLLRQHGDPHEAEAALRESLDLRRQLGDLAGQAAALHNRAALFFDLGRFSEAVDDFGEALRIHASLPEPQGEARSRVGLGDCLVQLGQLSRAIEQYEQALALQRQIKDFLGQAATLNNLGFARRMQGRFAEAETSYAQSLALFRGLQDNIEQARVLNNLGVLSLLAHSPEKSLGLLAQAESLLKKGEPPEGLWLTLLHTRAGALLALGELAEAETVTRQGIDRVESLRKRMSGTELDSAMFEGYVDLYDVGVQVLLAQDELEPGRGHGLRAYELSEQARSRTLLDQLAQHADRGQDRHPLKPADSIAATLHAEAAARSRSASLDQPPEHLRELWWEYDQQRASQRRSQPGSRPGPLGLSEIQAALLDEDTVLLHYELGLRKSVVWVITDSTIERYSLPPSDVVERQARDLHDLLSTESRLLSTLETHLLAELSDQLLGPAKHLLAMRTRVLVSAAGALAYLPFAALPDPCDHDAHGDKVLQEPLFVHHSVTRIHSASTAVLLASRQRASPKRRLVIVAAPAFSAPLAQTGATDPKLRFPSLGYAEEEARAIASLAPSDQRLLALGTEARVDLFFDGSAADAAILHLATHGSPNKLFPQFSYLVFSLFDGEGHPLDGFLYAYQVRDLDLDADLVVLSACGTALGREVRGEGLVGLSQPFLVAGARQVIASLWPVSDRATAQLMTELYGHLLGEGLTPAEALRRAQIHEWQAGASSTSWAAFVIEGAPD